MCIFVHVRWISMQFISPRVVHLCRWRWTIVISWFILTYWRNKSAFSMDHRFRSVMHGKWHAWAYGACLDCDSSDDIEIWLSVRSFLHLIEAKIGHSVEVYSSTVILWCVWICVYCCVLCVCGVVCEFNAIIQSHIWPSIVLSPSNQIFFYRLNIWSAWYVPTSFWFLSMSTYMSDELSTFFFT